MTSRITFLRWVFLFLFAVILGRLATIQIFQRSDYETIAKRQDEYANAPPFRRGDIYLRSKDDLFLAATEKQFYTLAINPKRIKSADAVYQHLKTFFDIDKDEFYRKASLINDPFEILRRRVSKKQKEAATAAGAPDGIVFVPENLRYYPGEKLGAHILGFIGNGSEEEKSGKYGIEQYYNKTLRFPTDGYGKTKRAPAGILKFLKRTIGEETQGMDVILTIDAGVETTAEYILDSTLKRWSAVRGGIIVLQPKTGKVLAMAVRPTFDPNLYFAVSDIGVFVNPLVQSVFEMGSVLKPITMAAAIDKGVVVPETTYYDYGYREIDGYRIKNYDGKGRGRVEMQEILSQSLNTGAVFLMEQLGKKAFRGYITDFGLGEKTGVDLAGEVKGNLDNLNSPRLIEYATAAFGQGISVTPIGLATALSAIANGGKLMRPYVVEELRAPSGYIRKREPEVRRRVISEEAAHTVTRMLVKMVDTVLEGGKGPIPGYSMAAKTGTAEIPSRDQRGYSKEFLHSFFGYAPAYDPEFLVFLYIERPVGARYASQTLTKPYKDLMRYLLSYYDIMPDRL